MARRLALWAMAVAMVALVGCASEPTVQIQPVSGRIVVGKQLNPNAGGRPSPVVLTIYQLRRKAEFVSASYRELAARDEALLGDALIGRDTLMLCPIEQTEQPRSGRASRCQGPVKPITLEIPTTARYLGVVAAFYDLHDPAGDWRDVATIPEEGWFGSREFVIRLHRTTVSVDFQ